MIDLVIRNNKLLLVLDKENLDTLFDYASRNKYFKVKLYKAAYEGESSSSPEKIFDAFIEPCGINKDDGLGLLVWMKDPDTEETRLIPMWPASGFSITSNDGKELIAYQEFQGNYFTIYNDFETIDFNILSPVGTTHEVDYVYKFVKQDTNGRITVSIIEADSTDIANRRTFTFDPNSEWNQGYKSTEIDPVIPTVMTQTDVDRDLLKSLNNKVKKLELLNADPDLVEAEMLTSWVTVTSHDR